MTLFGRGCRSAGISSLQHFSRVRPRPSANCSELLEQPGLLLGVEGFYFWRFFQERCTPMFTVSRVGTACKGLPDAKRELSVWLAEVSRGPIFHPLSYLPWQLDGLLGRLRRPDRAICHEAVHRPKYVSGTSVRTGEGWCMLEIELYTPPDQFLPLRGYGSIFSWRPLSSDLNTRSQT